MDYFSKFLRTTSQPSAKVEVDHAQEFHKSWNLVKNTLLMPDERQLTKGIGSTNVPALLRSMVDSLVWESTRIEEGGTGACLEYLLKNDVLGTLVRLSETDRPPGIQAEVLRAVSNMVVLLDEQFLVHTAVHKAVLRLLRNCVGDDLQEQLDGRSKLMGAARNVIRPEPSEHEQDLVNLLCILCSRIRTYRELLMIFFHDKHWYRSEPLFSVEEDEEDELEEEIGILEDDDDDDPDTTLKGIKIDSSSLHETTSSNLSEAKSEQKKPEYEFLLFNYLLRFVHREGHIGEFARAGLLFLMDVAMSSGETQDSSVTDPVNDAALALAEYILDGDFSEVLGAGLSAVYSLLPSKLGFFAPKTSAGSDNAMTVGGPNLTNEDGEEKADSLAEKQLGIGVEDARSPEFKLKMDHFLTLLMFLQDVLRRNVSHDSLDASALVGSAIVQSILDAVRRIFLENVLYPSVLECSDVDGSAVAVMSYIDIMIRSLRDGPLANLLVDFLISEDNDDPRFKQRTQPVVISTSTSEEKRKKRRQSSAMTLLEMEAPESRKRSDYFTSMGRFTLKDLLISNLKSQTQSAATSALQLLQTMFTYHPQLTTERLLVVIPDSFATIFPHRSMLEHRAEAFKYEGDMNEDDDEDAFPYPGRQSTAYHYSSVGDETSFARPLTTYATHEREMDLYLALIRRIDPFRKDQGDNFSTGYDHYLHDALVTIQSQPVYWTALQDHETTDSRFKHRININDPILSLTLESLTAFFTNTPEFNIGLTGVLATFATHPDRSLAGWITFAIRAEDQVSPLALYETTGGDDGDDRSIDFTIEMKLASESSLLPAASMDDKSRPIIYTILQGLVDQLDRYRNSVDDFDKFLQERRQGLLFSENLSDALALGLNTADERKRAPVPSETVQGPKPKPKPSVSSSSFVPSFLTPKKNKPTKTTSLPSEPIVPARSSVPKSISASPFGNHYKQTGSVKVEPLLASIPSSAPWTPSKSKKWSIPEEDVFTSTWGEPLHTESRDEGHEKKLPEMNLSQLLDNVVILEESIKELVAIVHARRSLGIDSLRYI